MKLQDMSTEALHRLYRRIYHKYADCYGIDARTLRITAPGALAVLAEIYDTLKARGDWIA